MMAFFMGILMNAVSHVVNTKIIDRCGTSYRRYILGFAVLVCVIWAAGAVIDETFSSVVPFAKAADFSPEIAKDPAVRHLRRGYKRDVVAYCTQWQKIRDAVVEGSASPATLKRLTPPTVAETPYTVSEEMLDRLDISTQRAEDATLVLLSDGMSFLDAPSQKIRASYEGAYRKQIIEVISANDVYCGVIQQYVESAR